jgi:hypothetical protein
MKAEDFLSLLKEWAILCYQYVHGNNAYAAPPVEDEEEEGELEEDVYLLFYHVTKDMIINHLQYKF